MIIVSGSVRPRPETLERVRNLHLGHVPRSPGADEIEPLA